MFLRTSEKIAPLGTRTAGWEWRDKLKSGDRIDVFNNQGHWYLGTVLDTRIEKETIKMLSVAFRYYTPKASNVDIHGQTYEGWNETYDTCLPAYSTRIQKYLHIN